MAVNVPYADGVPAMTPEAAVNATPGGNDPEASDHTTLPT
jgi:hypothetical protein